VLSAQDSECAQANAIRLASTLRELGYVPAMVLVRGARAVRMARDLEAVALDFASAQPLRRWFAQRRPGVVSLTSLRDLIFARLAQGIAWRIVIIRRNRLSAHQGFPFTWLLADAIVGDLGWYSGGCGSDCRLSSAASLSDSDPMIASDFDALAAGPVVHPFFEGARSPSLLLWRNSRPRETLKP
jgi:hypothetical protein